MAVMPLLIVVLVLSCATSSSGSVGPVVQTIHGPVRGLTVKEGEVFFGIPFAAPPIGDLRWRPPQPVKPWGPGVYNATKRSAVCIQHDCGPNFHDFLGECPPPSERVRSEDCLYLNVYVPKSASPTTRKPVIFFIHGGNFLFGSGMGILYDGRVFANKTDTVVVAINYRLGGLGFLRAGIGEDASLGNYGLLDQIAALQWVQDNIHRFGGDEAQVTLFGESAGAYSVLFHMVSERSDKLFHKAIVSSAPTGLYFRNLVEAGLFGIQFAQHLNCTPGDMNCMRKADASDIERAQNAIQLNIINPLHLTESIEPWGPIVDGDVVTSQMVQAFSSGHFQRKPLIMGTNKEEAVLFIYRGLTSPLAVNRYQATILAIFKTSSFSILTKYPPTHSGDERQVLSEIGTHFIFACPTRNIMKSALKLGHSNNTWMYLFNHPISDDGAYRGYPYCRGYVCHGYDLPFEFQSPFLSTFFNFTSEEQVLADSMGHYLGNFAHTGNPNNPGTRQNSLPTDQALNWPTFGSAKNYNNIVFDVPKNSVEQGYLHDLCDFWDEENQYP